MLQRAVQGVRAGESSDNDLEANETELAWAPGKEQEGWQLTAACVSLALIVFCALSGENES